MMQHILSFSSWPQGVSTCQSSRLRAWKPPRRFIDGYDLSYHSLSISIALGPIQGTDRQQGSAVAVATSCTRLANVQHAH